jgi:hypothetical protein
VQHSTTTMSQPSGPYRLVTVNNAPERAKRLIGRVVESLKDHYTIIHVANCDSLDLVESTVKEYQPDVLVRLLLSWFERYPIGRIKLTIMEYSSAHQCGPPRKASRYLRRLERLCRESRRTPSLRDFRWREARMLLLSILRRRFRFY